MEKIKYNSLDEEGEHSLSSKVPELPSFFSTSSRYSLFERVRELKIMISLEGMRETDSE